MKIKEIKDNIEKVLDDNKAQNIICIDLKNKSSLTRSDYWLSKLILLPFVFKNDLIREDEGEEEFLVPLKIFASIINFALTISKKQWFELKRNYKEGGKIRENILD